MNNSSTPNLTHPFVLSSTCAPWIVLLLLLALSAAVQAQFLYTITNGTVTITGYTGPGGAVVIPSKINGLPVTSIGAEAFQYCTSLTDITIPYSVTNIGVAAFWRCTSLKAITVDTDNPAYSSADAILFDKSQTTLVECPGGKAGAYSIPDSVTSIADLSFSFCTSLTSITIPNGVTSIGYETFWSCTSLTSITISDSVTSIGDLAFTGCSSVTNIAIPTSVTCIPDEAFSGCFSLTSVTIPNSVTDIGDDAFSYCFSLSIVTIPNSVTNIGTNAFSHGGLTLVTIGYGVNSIRDGAFSAGGLNAVIFQGNAPSLGSGVFYTNNNTATVYYMPGTAGWGPRFGGLPTKLWNPETQFSYTTANGTITITGYTGPGPGIAVTIPDTINGVPVTNIGDDAFANCGSLTSVTIPNSLVRIGTGAFGGCGCLTSITIPNSVISIGDSAFVACTGLTNATIGSGATSIGDGAFGLCTHLPSISVDALNSAYSSVDGVLFNKTQTTLLQYPGGIAAPSYTIPNSVTIIGDWSFANCQNLKSVTIPNSITSIEDDAFWNTGLTNVTIGSGATSIGVGAFGDCTSLTSISIDTLNSAYSSVDGALFNKTQTTLVQYPAGITATSYMIPNGAATIGYLAFAHCTNLTSVTIPNSVTSIADHAFWNSFSLTNVTIGNGVTSVGSRAFIECTSLVAVYFQGNAPSLIGEFPFDGDNYATVYYLPGTTGWGTTFGGRPTSLWIEVPAILNSPQTQTTEVGSEVGLRVKANSPLPLFYFWYLNATNLLSSGTNWQVDLHNVQLSQSGTYTVVVSNVLGEAISAPAMLNVIAAVERRPVPGVIATGAAESLLNVDYADSLSPAPSWATLGSVSLASTSQYYFDLTLPLPAQRFYRAWQTGAPGVVPSLGLHMVPAITLTGSIGGSVRVDAINQFGPIDAWFTLDTVTLTNTSQLYFDTSRIGRPQRLYRAVPSP
jgi:hypothetical protein